MPKNKLSAKQPKRSRKATAPEPDESKFSPLARSILKGLREGAAHARGEIRLRTRTIVIPGPIDIRSVREKLGLSQSDFAARFGFALRTLQEWEQGRSSPDTAVRAYLHVIDKQPKVVEAALGAP